MKTALIAFLFFVLISLISGTIKAPTADDITLLIASFSLLIIAWLRNQEKNDNVGKNGETAARSNKGK